MFKYYVKLSMLSLRKTPALSTLIVLAIALGIGMSMTTLTVYHMMSGDPIPDKSERLFAVQLESQGKGISYRTSDGLQYQITYQDANNLHKSTIPVRKTRMLKSGSAVESEDEKVQPFMAATRFCDNDFFKMFNFRFLHGNTWDDNTDIHSDYIAVISSNMSERLFGKVNGVGQTIILNETPYTIIGITEENRPSPFFYDLNSNHFAWAEQIFVPFSLIPKVQPQVWGNIENWKEEKINSYQDSLNSESFWIQYWAELNSAEQASEYKDYLDQYIEEQKGYGRFEKEQAKGDIKNVNQWLEYNKVVSEDNRVLVILSFLFLAACLLNTVGLLLSKFHRTIPLSGIRRALGANRIDLIQQYAVETIIIGIAGGLIGLGITWFGLQGLKSIFHNYENLAVLDITMVITTFGVSILSALLAGALPIARVCQSQPSTFLKTQ